MEAGPSFDPGKHRAWFPGLAGAALLLALPATLGGDLPPDDPNRDRGRGLAPATTAVITRFEPNRVIAFLMNRRSCLMGIATGDQAIAVRRVIFDAVGGYPELPLMEDIALSRLLRKQARPACLPVRVTTSSRRWERNGVWRTIWLMWSLRWAYWRGGDVARLAKRYRGGAAS